MKGKLFFKMLVLLAVLVPAFAFAEIKNIDVAKADELMKTGKYVVVDVRTDKEYADGHIKGAINVDYYGDFEKIVEKTLKDKNEPYILYCRSGVRSANSAKVLEKLGYKDISNMEGGFLAWEDAGKPVSK